MVIWQSECFSLLSCSFLATEFQWLLEVLQIVDAEDLLVELSNFYSYLHKSPLKLLRLYHLCWMAVTQANLEKMKRFHVADILSWFFFALMLMMTWTHLQSFLDLSLVVMKWLNMKIFELLIWFDITAMFAYHPIYWNTDDAVEIQRIAMCSNWKVFSKYVTFSFF